MPDIKVDDHVAPSEPKPLTGPEPVAHAFNNAWTSPDDLPQDAAPVPTPIEGNLVMAASDGLRAYDARSGLATWHHREPERELTGVASTDGVLVIETTGRHPDFTEASTHLVGLDAGTGQRLWERLEIGWMLTHGGAGGALTTPDPTPRVALADAADGVVPALETDPFGKQTVHGIEASTGNDRWRIGSNDPVHACQPTTTTSRQRSAFVPILLGCGTNRDSTGKKMRAFAAIDPRSGDPRWERRVSDTGQAASIGGISLLDGQALWPDGRPIDRALDTIRPKGCTPQRQAPKSSSHAKPTPPPYSTPHAPNQSASSASTAPPTGPSPANTPTSRPPRLASDDPTQNNS